MGNLFSTLYQLALYPDGTGEVPVLKANIDRISLSVDDRLDDVEVTVDTVDPGLNDDSTQGYAIGSPWLNTTNSTYHVAESVGIGAAVWLNLTTTGAGDMTTAIYDAANVTEQLAGLTAIQALTNKSVNGVTLDDSGAATSYLDQTGAYSIPPGGGGLSNIVEDLTPQLGGFLDANGNQVRWAKGADVASAAEPAIGDDGNFYVLTGSTNISGLPNKGLGTVIRLALPVATITLVDSFTFVLPTGSNITTNGGDIAEFVQTGIVPAIWTCTNYMTATGVPLAGTHTQNTDTGTTGASFTLDSDRQNTDPAADVDLIMLNSDTASLFTSRIRQPSAVDGNRIWSLPNITGTFAMLSDITGITNTTSSDFEINSGGFSTTIKTTNLTADRAHEMPDRAGQVALDTVEFVTDATTNRTVLDSDQNKVILMTNAAANTVDFDTGLSMPVGATVHVSQQGAGQTTIAGTATINSPDGTLTLRVQYSTVTLIQTAADVWTVMGDIG